MEKNGGTALALDACDLHRLALRREREDLAPARRAGAPERDVVDVDDEIAVALPGQAAGVAAFAVVACGAAGPDCVADVAVGWLWLE